MTVQLEGRDEYLELLLQCYLPHGEREQRRDDQFPTDVTFILSGAIITGRPIAAERFYWLHRQLFLASIEHDVSSVEKHKAVNDVNALFDGIVTQARMQSELLSEGEHGAEERIEALEEFRSDYVHLESATVVSGQQRIIGGLFRIRLADINGWTLGRADDR